MMLLMFVKPVMLASTSTLSPILLNVSPARPPSPIVKCVIGLHQLEE
jgi:hypothetical protein